MTADRCAAKRSVGERVTGDDLDHILSRYLKQSLPFVTMLVISLLILSISAILYLGREIFIPVALAILLSFVVAPAVGMLQRVRIPHGLAVVMVVVTAVAGLGLLGLMFTSQVSGLAEELPKYEGTLISKIERLRSEAGSSGTLDRITGVIQSLAQAVKGRELPKPHPQDIGAPAADKQPVAVTIESSGGFFTTASGVLSPLLQPLATAAIVLLLTIFVLSQREDLRNRFIKLAGADDLQHTTEVMNDVARRLSKYFLTQFTMNASYGLIIGIGLWWIGVPHSFLWAVFAAISRFVPYIGPLIGATLPLLLTIGVDPEWSMFLWTLALFVGMELLVSNVLEPLLYGHSTGLSPVAVVLSATVWAFLWGPIGLVLSTPLTVCLAALGRHVRQFEFLDTMLGDSPSLSPAEIFYQRMLAGDPAEAIRQAQEFLRERALATYYDEVALEGIRLAQGDIARGSINLQRQTVLRLSILKLIDELDSVKNPRPPGGAVGTEAAAAVIAAGPDRPATMIIVKPEELPPAWRGKAPVLCVAAPDTLDEVMARMLVQVLTKHGLPTRAALFSTIDGDVDIDPEEVRMVCLSYLEPLSILHLRFAVRAVRRRFKSVVTLLGIWRQRDSSMATTLREAARADVFATTIHATLAAALAAAGIGVQAG